MNQVFKFEKINWPGWFYPILAIPLLLYYAYFGDFLKSFDIAIFKNKLIYGLALIIPLLLPLYLINYLLQIFLKTTSRLEIKNNHIELVMFLIKKWSIPISSITEIDPVQGQTLTKADVIGNITNSQKSKIGFSFKAGNKLYYVKPFLEDFDKFKREIIALNPNIKLETLSQNIEYDLYWKKDISKHIMWCIIIVVLIIGLLVLVNKLF